MSKKSRESFQKSRNPFLKPWKSRKISWKSRKISFPWKGWSYHICFKISSSLIPYQKSHFLVWSLLIFSFLSCVHLHKNISRGIITHNRNVFDCFHVRVVYKFRFVNQNPFPSSFLGSQTLRWDTNSNTYKFRTASPFSNSKKGTLWKNMSRQRWISWHMLSLGARVWWYTFIYLYEASAACVASIMMKTQKTKTKIPVSFFFSL